MLSSGWYLKWDSVILVTSCQDSVELKWLKKSNSKSWVCFRTGSLLWSPSAALSPFASFPIDLAQYFCSYFSAHRARWPSSVPTLNITFISWLFFPVRCFIITNSNKGFFKNYYYLRYSVAFVFLASAVTSEDCIQGAKCAGPRVRAAEYTNLRKHRQWIANDTQNKMRKKTFTQKTTKELYRHWIGFLYTLILLNCVW